MDLDLLKDAKNMLHDVRFVRQELTTLRNNYTGTAQDAYPEWKDLYTLRQVRDAIKVVQMDIAGLKREILWVEQTDALHATTFMKEITEMHEQVCSDTQIPEPIRKARLNRSLYDQ